MHLMHTLYYEQSGNFVLNKLRAYNLKYLRWHMPHRRLDELSSNVIKCALEGSCVYWVFIYFLFLR